MYIKEKINCSLTLPMNMWGCVGIATEISGYLSP